MKLTKAEMKKEALERMEMLRLDEDIRSEFEKHNRILVTDQQLAGYDRAGEGSNLIIPSFPNFVSVNERVYQLFTEPPNQERLQFIKELEQERGLLVYHVIRVERSQDEENDYDSIAIFLAVGPYKSDWKEERGFIQEGSVIYGYSTIAGYPQTVNYVEFGLIPIYLHMSCVVATNVI